MLRKLIRSLMERPDKDITNSELAYALKVSDATISNFFNYKNELTFTSYLLAIRFLAPDKEEILVDSLAEEMIKTENRLNCRLLMEYASTKKNFLLLEKLITSQKKAPKENKDWADIYEISMGFQNRTINNQELLNMLDSHKPKTEETRLFLSILKSYVMYRMEEYKTMFRMIKSIEKDIEKIKNPYIRESYTARFCEVLARGYLYLKNDVKKSRYYANIVINSKMLCPKFTSHMYHLLGTSFLFENYEISIEYFKSYCNILGSEGREELARIVEGSDIYFAKVYWGQATSELETDDELERMHYYARKGDTKEVEALLNEDNCENPFSICYLGIASNNPELLIRSVAKFIDEGNKFFAELPRKELLRFPVYSVSANAICSINIA